MQPKLSYLSRFRLVEVDRRTTPHSVYTTRSKRAKKTSSIHRRLVPPSSLTNRFLSFPCRPSPNISIVGFLAITSRSLSQKVPRSLSSELSTRADRFERLAREETGCKIPFSTCRRWQYRHRCIQSEKHNSRDTHAVRFKFLAASVVLSVRRHRLPVVERD